MTDPLAEPDDVAGILQRALTPEEVVAAVALIAKASKLFRAESGQDFTPGESTVRLKVNGGRVRLEQRPVTAVSAVVDDGGDAVPHTRNGMWLRVGLDSSRFVTVSYIHGGDVPDDVRTAVAEMVARSLIVPEDVRAGASMLTDTMGPNTQTTMFGVQSVKVATLSMTDADVGLAQSYRWQGGQVIVQAP